MEMEFGAMQDDAVSEEQQATSPVEKENSALDSDESLRNVPDFGDQEEEQQETQEDQQDAESSPGVEKRIDQMRRKLGDVERREERAWGVVDELKARLDQIETANKKEEVPQEQTIEYWQAVKRHPDYVDDQKVQDQCDVKIQEIIAERVVNKRDEVRDAQTALQQQHAATYARMAAKHPQYAEGTAAFNEAAKIFYESVLYQSLPNGTELAINQHIAEKAAPTLQKAKDDVIETTSKLKKEIQKSELGTSTRGAPKVKKAPKEQKAYDKFMKTGSAFDLIKERLHL